MIIVLSNIYDISGLALSLIIALAAQSVYLLAANRLEKPMIIK